MIVKICGITRADDARLAASLGATHIGLVFWPRSPRAVTREAAARIVAELPDDVTVVGVFVNAPSEEMNATADAVGLDILQLHGDEQGGIAASLRRPIIKAIPLPDAGDAAGEDLAGAWPGVPLLLDAHDPVRRGGTGVRVDWRRAAVMARTREVILAGGLGPLNVGDALQAVRPAGVDVSSGVEARPGVKDPARLRALFEAIRGVEV